MLKGRCCREAEDQGGRTVGNIIVEVRPVGQSRSSENRAHISAKSAKTQGDLPRAAAGIVL